jgi:hypothetical protein
MVGIVVPIWAMVGGRFPSHECRPFAHPQHPGYHAAVLETSMAYRLDIAARSTGLMAGATACASKTMMMIIMTTALAGQTRAS